MHQNVRKYTKRKSRSNKIALDDKNSVSKQLYAIAVDRFFGGLKNSKDEMFKPISKKDEREMIERLRNDRKSIEFELIKHNIFVAINLATKNSWRYTEYDSLISNAMFGLCEAATKFDIDRGTKFSTYATQWIRKRILYPFFNDTYDKNITKKTSIYLDSKDFRKERDEENYNYTTFSSSIEPSVEFCYSDIKNPSEIIADKEIRINREKLIDNISISIAASGLSQTDKSVYRFMFIDGKSADEIASELQITKHAISKSRVRIATFVSEKFGNLHRMV